MLAHILEAQQNTPIDMLVSFMFTIETIKGTCFK